MDLITQRLKLKELGESMSNLAKSIANEFNIKEDDVQLIRKGITIDSADLKIEEGERAVISYITTAAIDRDGEIVMPSGAILREYKKNPVVLFGHDYKSLPVGRNEWIKRDEKGLIAKTVYAKHAEAEKVFQFRKDGFPLAESIGFVPIDYEDLDEDTSKKYGGARRIYKKWVLLEYSDVPIPSNPEALQLAIAKGLIKIEDDPKEEEKKEEKEIVNKLWEDKPSWTEIKYRIKDPDNFERIRRMTLKTSKPRIFALVGPIKGDTKTSLQALRFPKADGWTLSSAKSWVSDHPEIKKEVVLVEPCLDELEQYVKEQKEKAIDDFIKEGRILSTKNKTLIKQCIDSLSLLLAATEPPEKDSHGVQSKYDELTKTINELKAKLNQ